MSVTITPDMLDTDALTETVRNAKEDDDVEHHICAYLNALLTSGKAQTGLGLMRETEGPRIYAWGNLEPQAAFHFPVLIIRLEGEP